MPHRLPLVLVLGALALAGCDSDDDDGDTNPPPPTTTSTTPAPEQPEPKRQGVVLFLNRANMSPGDTLQLTVENFTKTRLEYGVAYRLERRTADGWRWINRDSAFILILKVVEPGRREREEIRLPDDLQPGHYRIVKSFMAPATGRRLDATIEFQVR
jgi:hypothetical protein